MARRASSAKLLLSRSITDTFSPALHPNSAQSNVHVDFSRVVQVACVQLARC